MGTFGQLLMNSYQCIMMMAVYL